MEFPHSSLVLCIHTRSPEDLALRAGKLLILGVRPWVQVISHPYSVNSRGQKLWHPPQVRCLPFRDRGVGFQTGKKLSLEEKPMAPLLVSPGKAPGRLVQYSHCGIPILSLWFSSTWSHLHWAGIGHSEPEEAGVWEESLSFPRKWFPYHHPSSCHAVTAIQRALLMGEKLPVSFRD